MYYSTKVQFTEIFDTKNGGIKEKNFTKEYLVEAESCMEAETKTIKQLGDSTIDYEVKEVKQSRIEEVFD